MRATAICGALAFAPVAITSPAAAQQIHDGIWRVAAEPATGPCSKRLEFSLAVEDGQIRYSGVWPVDASGSVTTVGVIRINVARSGETVTAKGVVRGDTASGKWVSPEKNCTGSWTATKA